MNNVYGTKKPALIDSSDIEIFYHYRPSRNSDDINFQNFKKIDSNILTNMSVEEDDITTLLPGMYNLRLPLNIFNKKGIYTLYIKPKEIYTNILDVSTLAAYPNIRGVVIDTSNIEDGIIANGSLVGYRVEYFNDENIRSSDFRIITSNNRCEPVAQNLNDSMQKGVRYRFNESSNLMFCTLTPSVGMSFKANSIPYIGTASQKIALINTKFNPFMVEVEMVEHDDETISIMLEGEQLRNLETGTITTFNADGGIYNQVTTGTITDPDTGLVHDFKINNINNVDFNEDIEEIKDNI